MGAFVLFAVSSEDFETLDPPQFEFSIDGKRYIYEKGKFTKHVEWLREGGCVGDSALIEDHYRRLGTLISEDEAGSHFATLEKADFQKLTV